MFSDELLREALTLSLEGTIAFHKRESEENPHRFSLAYKIREKSIIRLAERYETEKPPTERRFIPLKRLALFMAIIAAAVVLSVGAYAAYLIINGFVFDVHEEYARVTLDISNYELKDTISELYWLPPESGWECVSEMFESEIVMSDYKYDDNTISLIQYTKINAEQFVKFNTEEANIYGVKINGNDGFVTIRNREELYNDYEIVWVMDGYVFYIAGLEIAKDDLIELAKSVVIKESSE